MPKPSAAAEVGRLAPARVSGFAFGVRYIPQYALMDVIGTVIDHVLRGENTPFGPDTFPLSQATPTAHTLVHPETRSSLRLSTQDAILQMPLDTSNLERLVAFAEHFQHFVLTPLRKLAGLKGVMRYGMVVHLASVQEQLKSAPIKEYLGAEFEQARSLSMRFTRRLPSLEALVKKRVTDFRNAIYTVEQEETGEVNVALDYQEYFQPALDAGEWDDRPFRQCVDHGVDFCDRELRRWFTRLNGNTEVA